MKKPSLLASSFIALVAVLLLFIFVINPVFAKINEKENKNIPDENPWTEFGGIRPAVMVNGEIYYYESFFPAKNIPQSYNAAGKISSVTKEVPKKELQLQCGTEYSGTVFAGDETNTTVYVVPDSSESETLWCARFVCSKMAVNPESSGYNGILFYNGRLYEHNYGGGAGYFFEELPDGFEPVGNLVYVGTDNLPDNNFETNINYDNNLNSVERREVYANPDDDSSVYVLHIRYKNGSYTISYLKCKAFEK